MDSREKMALVIGGGIAGLEAANKIGSAGYKVVLVEKDDKLGGLTNRLYSSFPRWDDPKELINDKVKVLEENQNITVEMNTTVKSVEKKDKSFLVTLSSDKTMEFDSVVLATGFDFYDASKYGEYGYGSFENVLTALDFEEKLKEMESWDKKDLPNVVAFFKCVGSRDRSKGYPYCSKICCMFTAKEAGLMKDLNPDAKCFVFYMDYRASGKEYEEFVRSIMEEKHVRYVRGRPAKVLPENGKLMIRAEDTLMGIPVEIAADMIVLANAMTPREETVKLAEMFAAKTDIYGFIDYVPGHPAQAGERVFFAGGCGFPVESLGAMYQGAAAAADVIALFNQEAVAAALQED